VHNGRYPGSSPQQSTPNGSNSPSTDTQLRQQSPSAVETTSKPETVKSVIRTNPVVGKLKQSYTTAVEKANNTPVDKPLSHNPLMFLRNSALRATAPLKPPPTPPAPQVFRQQPTPWNRDLDRKAPIAVANGVVVNGTTTGQNGKTVSSTMDFLFKYPRDWRFRYYSGLTLRIKCTGVVD
jgi:hypothetical protein